MKTETVRYNNQLWNIDIDNNELVLPTNKRVRIDIDEVYDMLSDNDQNKIANSFAVNTIVEFEDEEKED